MEPRLLPLNAVLGLLLPNDVSPPALASVGFQLAGLEIPVAVAAGQCVVIDCLLFHPAANHILAVESKSGANVEDDQAVKYAALSAQAVVRASYVSLPERTQPTIEVAYACQLDHLERVRVGLEKLGLTYPIIAVSEERVRLDALTASDHLRAAFEASEILLKGSPPRLIAFDQDSNIEYIKPKVLAALVAAMSHRLPQLTLVSLAERSTPHYAVYGRAAQTQLRKRVTEAVRLLVDEIPGCFELVPQSGTREGMVRILKTPESNDSRGRTQAYQAIGRPSRMRKRSHRAAPNPDQLDLLSELDAADNEPDGTPALDEEVNDEDES